MAKADLAAIRLLHCSFCGDSQDKHLMLIKGPGHLFICDECVDLCGLIVAENRARDTIKREGNAIVSAVDAERLAWMKTWTVASEGGCVG